MTRKQGLLDALDTILEDGHNMIFILVIENPEMEKPEIIVNPMDNIKYKRDYIYKAYDDELCLKKYDKINIKTWYFI